MIVSPGMQTVSSRMFRQMDDKVSKIISGGVEEDLKDTIGLSASGSYQCIGLHTGAKTVVGNILGELLVKDENMGIQNETIVKSSRQSDPRRNLRLKVMEIGPRENIVKVDSILSTRSGISGFGAIILCIIPLLTIAGIVLTILAKDYGASTLIILNVMCSIAVTRIVRGNGVLLPSYDGASSPLGDVYIGKDDGKESYLILGNEATIQYLFQKSLIIPRTPGSYLHFLAAHTANIIVVVNIIAIPFLSILGQLIFGILMLFGTVQNFTLSMVDVDKLLVHSIENLFNIKPAERYIFSTKPTLIAYCTLRSGSSDWGKLNQLLPDTEIFEAWWDLLIKTQRDEFYDDKDGENSKGLMGDLKCDLRDAAK
ncbi:hypothetical protein BGZ76_004491, partial [Entomortierella beljakovae]